jgi:hypothetical protein
MISMKPYKILKPKQPLWYSNKVDVFVTEKRILKLPLKLFMKCQPIPVDKYAPKVVNVKIL